MNQNIKKQTNRKMRCFITITVLFTMLFCCMGCSKKTPREALEEAYEKTFFENNPTETLLGLTELNTKLGENAAHSTGFSVTLQELSGKDFGVYAGVLSGLGITVDSASDLLNRKAVTTMDITYGGTTYLTLGGQIQGSEIHLTSPQLLDSSLFVDLSTLSEDLSSDSMIAQALKDSGFTIPEDFSADILSALTSSASLAEMNDVITACETLYEEILVEKVGKKAVTLPEEIPFKTVYTVTIPKQAYVALLSTALDYSYESTASLSESLGETDTVPDASDLQEAKQQLQETADILGDIVMTVSVTKDGFINYATSTVKYNADTMTFTASFTGEKNPLEEVSVVMDGTAEGKAVTLSFEQNFDTENNALSLYLKATEDDTTVLTLDCAAEYRDIEKGKKYTLDFDYLELETVTGPNPEDIVSVSLAGDYYVNTAECNISAPKDSEYNLFRMSEEDFSALFGEVLANLLEDPLLSKLLGSFLSIEY